MEVNDQDCNVDTPDQEGVFFSLVCMHEKAACLGSVYRIIRYNMLKNAHTLHTYVHGEYSEHAGSMNALVSLIQTYQTQLAQVISSPVFAALFVSMLKRCVASCALNFKKKPI